MRTKQAFITGVAILAAVTMTSAVPDGGTVSGKVTYEGTPAKQKPIDMSKEPSCAKQYATPPPTETVVTGPNNGLENVVVYISAGGAAALTTRGIHPEGLPLYTARPCASSEPATPGFERRSDLA